jgi:hypothetical protein
MSFKPKVKKAQRKARARRAAKLKGFTPPTGPAAPAPAKFNKHLFEENQKLHKTHAAIANDARGLEKLMERKRWSNG